MKKTDLKKILKPLIKECVKEVMFEPGILSTVIQEVVRGVGTIPGASIMREVQNPVDRVSKQQAMDEEIKRRKQKIDDTRKKLLETIGRDGYNGINVFEGTEPLSKGGREGDGASPVGILANYAPGDPGVDISSLGLFKTKGNGV